MKRITLILAVIAILCVAGSQAQAQNYHHGHGGHYGGYHGPVVVHSPVWIGPRVVMPVPVYAPVYRQRCYDPGPSYGFYYQGRGMSIGVGF